MPSQSNNFYATITAAIEDFSKFGYDEHWRVEYWVEKITAAAHAALVPEAVLRRDLTAVLTNVYSTLVDKKKWVQYHKGTPPLFTINHIKPHLRGELDRAILASASLITLNRQASIGRVIRRFIGWATSIPPGGSKAIDRMEEKAGLKKAMASLPFDERRVIIDQGHKLTANINRIIAVDAGAIACVWHSHFRQKGYNYREDHKERDGHVYTIRNNWALLEGLMKVGPAGYTDKITQPGEEVFCRCFYEFLYTLDDLPPPMLTKKAKDRLASLDA